MSVSDVQDINDHRNNNNAERQSDDQLEGNRAGCNVEQSTSCTTRTTFEPPPNDDPAELPAVSKRRRCLEREQKLHQYDVARARPLFASLTTSTGILTTTHDTNTFAHVEVVIKIDHYSFAMIPHCLEACRSQPRRHLLFIHPRRTHTTIRITIPNPAVSSIFQAFHAMREHLCLRLQCLHS